MIFCCTSSFYHCLSEQYRFASSHGSLSWLKFCALDIVAVWCFVYIVGSAGTCWAFRWDVVKINKLWFLDFTDWFHESAMHKAQRMRFIYIISIMLDSIDVKTKVHRTLFFTFDLNYCKICLFNAYVSKQGAKTHTNNTPWCSSISVYKNLEKSRKE